jgi:hypothetical protein
MKSSPSTEAHSAARASISARPRRPEGAKRDAERVAVTVENRLQARLERGFADPGRADLHVGLAVGEQAALNEPRDDLLREHRLQLVGRTGQHAEHLAAFLDPETGGGAVRVGQHFAAGKRVGLLEVVGRHLAPEA